MTSGEPHTQRSGSLSPVSVAEPSIRLLLEALGYGNGADANVGTLHAAICDEVRRMRDAGSPPEAVLARMKRLAATALSEVGVPRNTRPGEATALVTQVGQWCIAEYFRKT